MIEILYPEICNLYGDNGNILFLKQTFTDKKIIYTHIHDVPYFVNHKVKLIYIASVNDENLKLVINELSPYKEKLQTLINNNTHFLLTGTALNIFAKKIKNEKEQINGLGLINVNVIKEKERKNCLYKGTVKNITILGFKSQFQIINSKEKALCQTNMGMGNNQKDPKEGIKKNNLYATSLLGPFLILNPIWTKELFKELSYHKKLPFEEELLDAYNQRLNEYIDIQKKAQK